MWQGPHARFKRPEDRKYSMWIKDAKDNNFIREYGMRCLADHEIGTHFVSFSFSYHIKCLEVLMTQNIAFFSDSYKLL